MNLQFLRVVLVNKRNDNNLFNLLNEKEMKCWEVIKKTIVCKPAISRLCGCSLHVKPETLPVLQMLDLT